MLHFGIWFRAMHRLLISFLFLVHHVGYQIQLISSCAQHCSCTRLHLDFVRNRRLYHCQNWKFLYCAINFTGFINNGQTAVPFFSFFSQHAMDRSRVGSSQ